MVETTGLADPAPMLSTLVGEPLLRHHYAVEAVVTTVDAVSGSRTLDRHAESVKQAAVADVLLVTKADTAAPADVAALEARLRALNPVAPRAAGRLRGDRAGRPPARPHARRSRGAALADAEEAGHDHARHDGDVRAFTLVLDEPLDWDAFAVWLTMLLHSRGLDVLRVKGLLDVGAAGPVVLDGVQHVVHRPRHLDAWPDDDRRSRIVFITRGIEREAVLASLEAFARARADRGARDPDVKRGALGAPLRSGASSAPGGRPGRPSCRRRRRCPWRRPARRAPAPGRR